MSFRSATHVAVALLAALQRVMFGRFAFVVAIAVMVSGLPVVTGTAPRAEAATAPAAPATVQAVPFDGSADVGWAPAADGGSPVTGYTVVTSPGGATVTTAGSATSVTVTGLTNGTLYTFSGTTQAAGGAGAEYLATGRVTLSNTAEQFALGAAAGGAFRAAPAVGRRIGNGATAAVRGVRSRLSTIDWPDDTGAVRFGGFSRGGDAGGQSRLAEASSAAFRAADDPPSIFIKDKHLASAPGNHAKLNSDDIAEVQGWVSEGLRAEGVQFLPNALDKTFRAIVPAPQVVGTRGQTHIRVIVTDDGRVINAFPVGTR